MNPSPDEPSQTSRLFGNRWVRLSLLCLGGLALLVAAFYAREDWRGSLAWNNYRRAAKGRGLVLDLKSYIPTSVPDEQNFAATPFVKSWFPSNGSILSQDDYTRLTNHISDYGSNPNKGHRQFVDLVGWQQAFAALKKGELKSGQRFDSGKYNADSRSRAASDVLDGLKSDEPAFAELRAASHRPLARYPVAYSDEDPWDLLLPHLNNIKTICQRLGFKACAELAAGHNEDALEDLRLLNYLSDSIQDEPLLISYLVRVRCIQIATQPVWEGLAEHRWTDAQLQEIRSHFQHYDFLPGIEKSFNTERAAGILTVELIRKRGFSVLVNLIDGNSLTIEREGPIGLISYIYPSGWYCQEELNLCQLLDGQSSGIMDTASKTISPRRVASNAADLSRAISGGTSHLASEHRILAAMLLPNLSKIPVRAAEAQTCANQIALACALERYRLANGQFPETLDALTPRFIAHAPNDVFTGQPYKYRLAANGQFVLYSVGWNEKDDGGVPGKTFFDQTQGDWVWEYPPE